MSSRVLFDIQVGPGGDPTRHSRASDETKEGRASFGEMCRSSASPTCVDDACYILQRRNPPSESRTWPVIQALSSETSHATRRATSSAVPQRPAGRAERT
jgi:hypothetical protein